MSTKDQLPDYHYRGARAMIIMHEQFMCEFLTVWREAKAENLRLPACEDTDYQSLDHLLLHIMRAARGYMVWICEVLGLPDPGIELPPPVEHIEAEAERYLQHLLEKWREPLKVVDEKQASYPSFKSRWVMDYSVDSMLEHAVNHPQRHSFQLRELME
jgi:uncharacterized damage-inducible protein DinB